MESVLLLLKIAHRGQQQQRQLEENRQNHDDGIGTEEEKSSWSSSNDMENEHDDDDEGFTAMKTGSSEASFICPLAGQTLRQPVTLPCQHSFSKAALEAFLENEEGKGVDTKDDNQSGAFQSMSRRCPNQMCREIIPPGALSINRALDENIAR